MTSPKPFADLLAPNPFLVLGIPPEATRAELERTGQKLLDMLAAGIASAATYPTAAGERARTPEAVREALAELRDPVRRLAHEVRLRIYGRLAEELATVSHDTRPWPGLVRKLGLGRNLPPAPPPVVVTELPKLERR